MTSIEGLRRELKRLASSLPAEDLEPWPPVPGSVDYALAAVLDPATIPKELPSEGAMMYLLDRVARYCWRDFDEVKEMRRGRGEVATS